MAEVTEAPLLVRVRVNRPGEPERWVVGAISKNDPAIAAALAEERRKARVPFRKMADAIKDGWQPSADRLADAIYTYTGGYDQARATEVTP